MTTVPKDPFANDLSVVSSVPEYRWSSGFGVVLKLIEDLNI